MGSIYIFLIGFVIAAAVFVAVVLLKIKKKNHGGTNDGKTDYSHNPDDSDKETDALCKSLSVEELYERARALEDEDGIASNYYRWKRFISTAAEKGYIPAVREWGVYNKSSNTALALELLMRAADAGDGQAVEELYNLYYYGSYGGVPKIEKDREKAVKFIRPYAEKGSSVARRLIGNYYRYEADDEEKALEWYLKASDVGDLKAMVEAADIYAFNDDFEAEKRLLLKAAEQNYAEAEINLGILFQSLETDDETYDYEKAMYWYKRAAEHGSDTAACYVGEMYLNGEGVVKDEYQAFDWFKKAYEQDSVYGKFLYGKCFMEGIGVARDMEKGIKLYTEAAEYDDSAQCALGLCYFEGTGVKKDADRARELWRKAAENDNDAAKEYLEIHFGETIQ